MEDEKKVDEGMEMPADEEMAPKKKEEDEAEEVVG